jgi:hypothetical protein
MSETTHPLRWYHKPRLLLLVAPLFAWLLYFADTDNSIRGDTWLDLTAGRQISAHGIPQTNTWTVFAAGHRWIDQQWLGQWLLYHIEQLGGILGLTIFTQCMYIGAVTILTVGLYRRGLAPERAALSGCVASVLLFVFVYSRVELFSFVLWPTLLWLLASGEDQPRRLVWLVPLLLFWGNVHGGVDLGITGVLAWSLIGTAEQVIAARPNTWRQLQKALYWPRVLTSGTVVAGVITPYGWHIFTYYQTIFTDPGFREFLGEWQPLVLRSGLGLAFITVVIDAFLIAVITIVTDRRIAPAWQLLLIIGLSVMAFHTVRFVPYDSLLICWVLGEMVNRKACPQIPGWCGLVGISAISIALIQLGSLFALGATSFTAMTEAAPQALAIVNHQLAQQPSLVVQGTTGLGDYLLWADPQLQGHVLSDNRMELFSQAQFRQIEGLTLMIGNWQHDLAGIGLIVIYRPLEAPLAAALTHLPGWQVLYSDATVLIAQRITQPTPTRTTLVAR